jgi:hypothetical protein
MAAKLKYLKGEGTRDPVKWVHGKYPPKKAGGPRRISATGAREPYHVLWELYETPEPKVKP